jgi:hypothetical protein
VQVNSEIREILTDLSEVVLGLAINTLHIVPVILLNYILCSDA